MRKCNCPVVFCFLVLEKREKKKEKRIFMILCTAKKKLLSEIFENTYASSDGCMTDFHVSEKEIV